MLTREAILAWQIAKEKLNQLKDYELRLRKVVTDSILGDKLEGSKTEKAFDFKLTAKAVVNYTIDKAALELYANRLTDEELECIKYEPKVVESKYKKLPEDSLLHRVVTAKPGTPQLSLEEIE